MVNRLSFLSKWRVVVIAPHSKENPAAMGNKKKSKKPARGLAAHRKTLRIHGAIARDVGLAIVSGKHRPGHVLEGEVEASLRLRISRTAYREAVRILAAKGLVNSRPRVGTRVSAVEEWHLLDPDVLSWIFTAEPSPSTIARWKASFTYGCGLVAAKSRARLVSLSVKSWSGAGSRSETSASSV